MLHQQLLRFCVVEVFLGQFVRMRGIFFIRVQRLRRHLLLRSVLLLSGDRAILSIFLAVDVEIRVAEASVGPTQLCSALKRVAGLGRPELTFVAHLGRVPLADELRYQLLNLIVIVHVLAYLLSLALVSCGAEGIAELNVNILVEHAFLERQIRPQIFISQLK